jgi:hypothetical protein
MTRSGRVVGHRILRRALLPNHAIPYTDLRPDFLRRSRASGLPADCAALGRRVDLVARLLLAKVNGLLSNWLCHIAQFRSGIGIEIYRSVGVGPKNGCWTFCGDWFFQSASHDVGFAPSRYG